MSATPETHPAAAGPDRHPAPASPVAVWPLAAASLLAGAERDKRQAPRRAHLSRGAAFQATPKRRLDCILKDISDLGCRLVGVGIDGIQSPFVLTLQDDPAPRACEVVWRRRRMIGVRFVSPTGAAASEDANEA
jgi:hypothetical protein